MVYTSWHSQLWNLDFTAAKSNAFFFALLEKGLLNIRFGVMARVELDGSLVKVSCCV